AEFQVQPRHGVVAFGHFAVKVPVNVLLIAQQIPAQIARSVVAKTHSGVRRVVGNVNVESSRVHLVGHVSEAVKKRWISLCNNRFFSLKMLGFWVKNYGGNYEQ